MLSRIQASGARHLAIPYFGCQTDIYSSDVGACEVYARGLQPFRSDPITLARRAQAYGFDVSFLPIIATPDWQWRGFFDPIDVPAWFKSYGAWIRRVAREAQALGMRELVVSTEMTRIYRHEDAWRRLLQDLRHDFDGPLILTVNWGDLNHGFWDEADAIGMSGYYPLSLEANPRQEDLDAAWQKLRLEFVELSRRWNRPIHMTEVGYQSASSAASTPWSAPAGALPDEDLQARCFDAFRKAWVGESALVRANIWSTAAEGPDSPAFPMSFEPLGKSAEQVLRKFFRHDNR